MHVVKRMFYHHSHNQYIKICKRAIIIALLFVSNHAFAATLSAVPASTKVDVGNIVSITISTNTRGEAINNAEGLLQFPTDLLEVVSISKSPSIFTLWVEEPHFSNTTGQVTFNGGIANPGYTGTSGTIGSIVFKAKKSGTANLIFTDAAVRKNDGLGTDILTAKNGSTITIGQAPAVVEPATPVTVTEPAETKNILTIPRISSATHPNQDVWSNVPTASFSWDIPGAATSLQTILSKKSTAIPNITYDNSVTQKTLTNLSDGTTYFLLRYKANGVFSPIARYKVNIDTTPPSEFSPRIRKDGFTSILSLGATDDRSGIEQYKVEISNGQILTVKQNELEKGEYVLPTLPSGDYTLTITAYDKAGNSIIEHATLSISPLSAPILSAKPLQIHTGDTVVIKGTSQYPHEHVYVVVESNGKEIANYTQTINANGTFELTTDPIDTHGTVTIWAENILGEKVHSDQSQKVYVSVEQVALVKITKTLLLVIVISILLFILLLALYIGWHKFFSLKKGIDIELEKTITEVHKAMLLLREELTDQLASLEKVRTDRDLNKKEEKIFKDIETNIENIDVFIEKKLRKITK